MAYLNPNVLDKGLEWLVTNGTRIDITIGEATTYSEATTDGNKSAGYKTSVTIGNPEARSPSGRKVIVPQITGGTVTESGTASHWAITDGGSILCAAGSISATQVVTDGNTWQFTAAFDIGIPDVA
jgi:hypothetical protein